MSFRRSIMDGSLFTKEFGMDTTTGFGALGALGGIGGLIAAVLAFFWAFRWGGLRLLF